MVKKVIWGEVDKRICARKATWSKEDSQALEADLKKLPDLAEQVDWVDLAQPALEATDDEEEPAPAEEGATEPTDAAADQSS